MTQDEGEIKKEEPLNREPALTDLISQYITPADSSYDRNHGPIPDLSQQTHLLKLSGYTKKTDQKSGITITMEQLSQLPQTSVISALQCAGNRRHTMRTKIKEVEGVDWSDAAVMNTKWTGVLLSEFLEHFGGGADHDGLRKDINSSEKGRKGLTNAEGHVVFSTTKQKTEESDWYGASIPLSRGIDPSKKVILALKMNDEPLTQQHGFPIRVIVPGVAGVRSVKWLEEINISAVESQNFYQTHDYKILPPEATDKEHAEEWWDKVNALQEMPVNSVVAMPLSGNSVSRDENNHVEVTGYALPQGDDGPVDKVEVAVEADTDEPSSRPRSWHDAELLTDRADLEGTQINKGEDDLRYAWTLYRALVPVPDDLLGKKVRFLSRATDKGGNTQVEQGEWNLRGVAYHGYGCAENIVVER